MRIVALEEHFIAQELVQVRFNVRAGSDSVPEINPGMSSPARLAELNDVGSGRLASMDAAGITVQVMSASTPGADMLDGQDGINFARQTNDKLARAIADNPKRFAGFAHLPMREPGAAAEELERTIKELGFCGAMVNGMTNDRFLDHPSFAPVFKMATKLGVPIYLHPNMPPKPVYDLYFDGLPGKAGPLLAGGGYGWHAETGLHILRLVAAGIFDTYPTLQMIVGHLGETLPFMVERADDVFHRHKVMDRHLTDVVREHLHITTSGFFTVPPFLNTLMVFGIDRMMFSVDHPYASNTRARAYLESLPISTIDREKLAFRNADALLGLSA
jgi:uncharacterized protein